MKKENRGGKRLAKKEYLTRESLRRGIPLLLSLCMVVSLVSGIVPFPTYARESAAAVQETEARAEIKARLMRQIREEGWDPYSEDMSVEEFYALMELFQEGSLPLEDEEGSPAASESDQPPASDSVYRVDRDTQVEATATPKPTAKPAVSGSVYSVGSDAKTQSSKASASKTESAKANPPAPEPAPTPAPSSVSKPSSATPPAAAGTAAQGELYVPRTLFLYNGLNYEGKTEGDVDVSSKPGKATSGAVYGAPLQYHNSTGDEPYTETDASGNEETKWHYPAGLDKEHLGYTRPPEDWPGVRLSKDQQAVVIVPHINSEDTTIAGDVDQSLFLQYDNAYVRRVTIQGGSDVTILGAVKPQSSDKYVYYYLTRQTQSTQVSATTLPEGQRFIVQYAHSEYRVEYRVLMDSIDNGEDVTGKYMSLIFGANAPINTDQGAYAFTASAPDGYTVSFYLAKWDEKTNGWGKDTAQLVTKEEGGPGSYKNVNQGWALNAEPKYGNMDGAKVFPLTDQGPQSLTTSGTFYNNDVDGPRRVTAVLREKAEPKFRFRTLEEGSIHVAGRGSTAETKVLATNRETKVRDYIPYDYEDEYLWRKETGRISSGNAGTYNPDYAGLSKYVDYIVANPIGNITVMNGKWNWENNPKTFDMTKEKDGTYSYTWTFQTNTGDFLLDSLEINRAGITIPFFSKYSEKGAHEDEHPLEADGTYSEDRWPWYKETDLPDGTHIRLEFLTTFGQQRVYRLIITNARNDVTVTGMNLNQYATGDDEISVYQVDGVTGATSQGNIRLQGIQPYLPGRSGWPADSTGNVYRADVIVGSVDYAGGDPQTGGANVRFKLATGYDNPYYLLESARYGTIAGKDGKPQASVVRDDATGVVDRDTQNPVVPYISDGEDPYMSYDDTGKPYPISKDGGKLYRKDDGGRLQQFTDWDTLRIRSVEETTPDGTTSSKDFLVPTLYDEDGNELSTKDVIAPKRTKVFILEKDKNTPLKSQYIYSGSNGWHYIRLTGQANPKGGTYKVALLTIVAHPVRYVVRYKPGEIPELPLADDTVIEAHPPSNMPTYPHTSSCPTFLQGDAPDKPEEQFDDNDGLFYDIEIRTDVALNLTQPTDPDGNFRFIDWVLVDQDDKPVGQHVPDVEDPNNDWIKNPDGSYFTREVHFTSGSFSIKDVSEFAILNGDLGTTENDIYVIRLMPVWEKVEKPFHYSVALNWVDSMGELHMDYFKGWEDVTTDWDIDHGPLAVKVIHDAEPIMNWIAQNPSYVLWDDINNADDGPRYDPDNPAHKDRTSEAYKALSEDEKSSAEKIRDTFDENFPELVGQASQQAKYEAAIKALETRDVGGKASKGENAGEDQNGEAPGQGDEDDNVVMKPNGTDDFDRLGSYSYLVNEDYGTIVIWMYENKAGLMVHKEVEAEPFIADDEFYFTLRDVNVSGNPLEGTYKAYPEFVYDADGKVRETLDVDAWLVRFHNGHVINIVKNDGSNWPSPAVTCFTIKNGESIIFYFPPGEYTIRELGSKSGGSYKADSAYYAYTEGGTGGTQGTFATKDGQWLRGDAKEFKKDGTDGASQDWATVNFPKGRQTVHIVTLYSQTSAVAFENTVIGLYRDEAMAYQATLILPDDTVPLYEDDGSYYYFNFNLYDIAYGDDQSANDKPPLNPAFAPPDAPKNSQEYQDWMKTPAYAGWLNWHNWRPEGKLSGTVSGRMVVKESSAGSNEWVSQELLVPDYNSLGDLIGWKALSTDIQLKDGQRFFVVCTVPEGSDMEINYYIEETDAKKYRLTGESRRGGKAQAAELSYELFINSNMEGLPATGGIGTGVFHLVGMLLVSSGLALAWMVSRKRRRLPVSAPAEETKSIERGWGK